MCCYFPLPLMSNKYLMFPHENLQEMGVEHLLDPIFLFNPSCSSSSRSLLRVGRSRGRRKQWRAAAKGTGLAAKKREKRGATTRVLWEKETTPQMSPDFASNDPQPFPSSTHRRSTFGQHFFGILQPLCTHHAPCLVSCVPCHAAIKCFA
jgi:hypothetical protein